MKYYGTVTIATEIKETPFLLLNREVIRQKFEEFRETAGNARIFYSVKANPHRDVIELLQKLGADFEVSSEKELSLLIKQGISPQRIISSNPVKSNAFIRAAYNVGVKFFAFDSHSELERLSKLAPDSKVYVRLSVSNKDSQWSLSKKFGVEIEESVALLSEAQKRGLQPVGITFHVGSQCIAVESWVRAIRKSKIVWEKAKSQDIELKMLNIGGGFPVRYLEDVPSTTQIMKVIKNEINRNFSPNLDVFIEPGRALVGEAGVLVTTVIAKAVRNGNKWLYLDVGVFNGLMETIGGICYPVVVSKNGPMSKWTLAGPSCDSFDTISDDVELPEVEVGDKVYIMSAGAYTTAYASSFNGFPIPKTYLR